MDINTKAITLTSADYKENDKMIALYSLEYGKINVHARGIKKAAAKLKFAQDSFCFGEFELCENYGRYTLKTCRQLEGFGAFRDDLCRYYAGCVVLESLLLTEEGEPNPRLFVAALKYLGALCVDGCDLSLLLVKYLWEYADISGYAANLTSCCVCGRSDDKLMYLDVRAGGVLCGACRTFDSMPLPKRVSSIIELASSVPPEKLNNLRFTGAQTEECLTVLDAYVANAVGRIKSVSEYLKLCRK